MSNDNSVLRDSNGQDIYKSDGHNRDEYNFDDGQCVNVIKNVKERSSLSEHCWKKKTLKRLRADEYNVEKASKYFESDDFRKLEENVMMEVSGEGQEVGVRFTDASAYTDNDGSAKEYDSDVSTSSGEDFGRSTVSHMRKGSYDFVSAEENAESSEAEICDEATSVGSEEFSESDSDISVTDSENGDNIDDSPNRFDSINRHQANCSKAQDPGDYQNIVQKGLNYHQNIREADSHMTLPSDKFSENKPARNKKYRTESYERACFREGGVIEISDETNFQEEYMDFERHMDTLHYRDDLDDVDSEAHVDQTSDPHGLIRKPAVRRRGYAWVSKSLPMNNRSDRMGVKHRDLDLGSSIDPSLYGHTDNDYVSARAATKTQSLPARTDKDSIDGVSSLVKSLHKNLQSERPVSVMHNEAVVPMVVNVMDNNKKRPLSRSSISPTSLTPYPRLRKKRVNTNDEDDFGVLVEDVHASHDTVVFPHNSKSSASLETRLVVNSDFTQESNSGERYKDMSIISENGILMDEMESCLAKDSSTTPSPTSENFVAEPSMSAYRTNLLSHSRESDPKDYGNVITNALITSNSLSFDQEKHKVPTSASETGHELPDSQFQVGLSGAEVVATTSPDILRRSSSSSSRHEARMKFFTNYEEYMSQSPTIQSPVLEEKIGISSESQSSSKNSSVLPSPSSSSLTLTTPGTPSDLKNHRDSQPLSSAHEDTKSSTSATTSEGRRGSSSKILRSSERTSKRSDRRGSSSKHDGFLSSSRSGFSRSSKKRDNTASSDPGNRSSQGYSSYVSRVVTEIIESERMYIASLEDIIHGYLEPMEKILNSNDAKKDIECLFSNVRDIYKFGCSFLADLELAGTDCVKVAQCFVKHNKGFVIYTDYCTNYPRAVEVLTRFMQHPELSELCKERQLALGHGLPLGAYLLKPVQRILKYHLLLHNIVKSCEKEKAETGILEQAFHHMTEMAHHINEMKRKHEHAVRIQEIQSQLEDYVGEDLTRLGELVLEGTFKVYGAKASRQVFLFERGLLISKKTGGGMLSCKAFVQCSNLMLVEVIPNEPLSFHIIPFDNPRAQYTLQARNMEQKRKWCQDIKQLILESFKGRIPENVKHLIMQLGREHDDDYVSKESLEAGRKNQHTAPEYLEKRRFRGKSGSRIPDFNILRPQKAKRGGNKKGDVRPGEKTLLEMARRAASKSPEGRHRIFTKQNVATKGRSKSSSFPAVPVSEMSATNPELSHNMTKTNVHSSPTSDCASPESPVYRSPKFTSSKTDEEEMAEGIKRPASFLMARANPILSADLTQLLARCGGTIKIQSPSQLKESKESEKMLPSHTNLEDLLEPTLRNRCDAHNSSDDEHQHAERHIWANNSKPNSPDLRDRAKESDSFENNTALSEAEISLLSKFNQSALESRRVESKSRSSHALKMSSNAENECKEEHDEATSKGGTESEENMYENINTSKARGRKSRRDMQAGDQNFRRTNVIAENIDIETSEKERRIIANHDINSKTSEENALKKKSLRLPNTAKHLLTQESEPDLQKGGAKAKLTNWNSIEKLTKGSMDDLSHLDEDPWIWNSEVVNSMPSMESESPRSSRPMNTKPRGHSDVTEMMQISNNKANMDWIVYLNRNSPTLPGHQSLVDETKVSTPALNMCSIGHENLTNKSKFPSQIPYATPPRELMTIQNMKRLGSVKDSDSDGYFYQDHSERNSATKKIETFGLPFLKITYTKPVKFTSCGLSRSNSTPISDTNQATKTKADFKIRPASLDMDKLNNESNIIIDEMKEYINEYSKSINNSNNFPTTIPANGVEDESTQNRLSVVSSISSSSYESQSGSSSDGLVGTLKSKLHAWAKNSRSRNDSEISCASTLTSDEEDNVHSKSGNISESLMKNRNSWKEDRQLETVLREHSLGSTKLGSRMAHSFTQPAEQIIPHHCSDSSTYKPHSQSTCGFSSMNKDLDESEKLSSETASIPGNVKFPLTLTNETTETTLMSHALINETTETTLMSHAVKNCDIQQSDSGFSLQSDESNTSDPALPNQKTEAETALEFSEESSEDGTSKAKLKMDNTKLIKESSDLARNDSSVSLDSKDSCYERKLSEAFESDIFQEKSLIDNSCELGSNEVLPCKKSIREYVKDFEEKLRSQSPKMFEVSRREPGTMIRQRLQTLRESALYGWRNVSTSSSKPYEEKTQLRSHHNIKPFIFKKDDPSDSTKSVCLKHSNSRDSLSKAMKNLSKSRDSVFLSRSRDSLISTSRSRDDLNRTSGSRDSLNSTSDASASRHSAPVFTLKTNNPGHEKDATRFHYKTPEQSQTILGNQFIHRTYSSSRSISESEMKTSLDNESDFKQSSKSVYQQKEPCSDTNNLVVMKGWVRSLISKFQVQS